MVNGFDPLAVPPPEIELLSLAGQQLSGDLIPRTYDHREIMYSDMAEDLTPRQQEAVEAGPGLLARAASMPLGFLAYAAGTIDKPFAAMRGLLAGHPEQLSLLLPFGESWLKPAYESIGIKIPEKHITGREMLEAQGLAPPNIEGFHPILNPTDAVFDVLGLAADLLVTPPFLPGIGGLTAKGKTAFGLAKKITPEAETLAKAASGVTKAIPETAAETFLNVAERRNPAVTLAGKFREIGRGERSVVGLYPMWPWNKLLSPIEPTGISTAIPEATAVSPGVRAARSLFDWSTMGQTSRVGQNSAQVISENTHQLRSAALNLSVLADEYNAGMANSFSKIAQYAELGGGDTVKLTFEHLARFIAENHHLKKRTDLEFADEVIRRLMPRAPAEATAMEHANIQKWVMDYRDFVENSMLKPATELFETNLKLGYPYGYLADTVNDYFPRYLAEGIMKKGEEAYGIKALQPAMKSREFGYKNNPGGALSSELAANDSILAAPVAESTTPAGYTTHTTGPNGAWWQKDEWVVTPNGKTGRIVGFSQDGALVKSIAGEPEEFLLSKLNRRGAAGPANRLDFFKPTGMTIMEQQEAALERLEYAGAETADLIGLKGKQKWFKARQAMMVDRYHRPFWEPSDPDAMEVFFTHPDTQKSLRAAAKIKAPPKPTEQWLKDHPDKATEIHFRDYLTGKGLSKKTAASVIEHMRDYGGTSAATLKKIGQFRGETPTVYETGLPNQLWKYMNSQADRAATLAGVYDGLLSSITVHDPKRNIVSILKNVFFGGEDPGGISLEEVYGSLGVKRGDKIEKLRPVGLETLINAWKAKNPEAAAIAEEIRAAREAAGPTIFRGETEAKEPVSLASVLRVPVEVQHTLQNILTLSSSPKDYLPFEKMVRQYTSWFSRWVTGPRLAFHMRNKTGDMVRLATADAPWTAADIFRNDSVFWKGVHGKLPGPIPYADEVNFIGDAMDSVRHSDISLMDPASKLLHQPGVPMGGFPNVLAALKTPWKGWTNIESYKPWMKLGPTPLGEEVVHPVLKAGERMFRLVEASSKYAAYASAREGGMNPGQAMAMVKRVMYDYCVDEKTQILTQRGWLYRDSLRVGDMALTLNPTTNDIEWRRVDRIHSFPFSGELTRWSRRVDALTSDNHRWLAKGSGKRGGHWSVRNKNAKTHFVTTAELNARPKKRIILGGGNPPQAQPGKIYSDSFVELAGWVITEGHYHTQNRCGVFVAQSYRHNPQYVARISKLRKHFANQGCTATEHKIRDKGWGPIHTFYFGSGIGDKIREILPDKQLPPDFLLALTPDQLRLLYDTLMAGDGHRPERGTDAFAQVDQGRVDSFQMLCSMLGKRTNAKSYANLCTRVAVYKATEAWFSQKTWKRRISKEFYDGTLWCPETKNSTWMARRGGYTYWTGNSTMSPFEKRVMQPTMMFYGWFRSNIAYMLPRIAFQWPSKVAQTTRALGRLPAQSGEIMPTWLQETFAIPLPTGETADGKTEVIRNFGLPMEDLAFFGPTVHETLMKAIAKTNPIIKGIYTAASGKDPFTDQVVAQKGGGMLGQLALGVTPAGVYLNNAKKLFPPDADAVPSWGEGLMRVLDASTGINVGHYNLKMQSLRDLQKQLHGELESTKNVRFYERPYIPPRFGEPPPETEKKIGEYRTLGTLMTMYGGMPRPVPRQTSNILGE